MSSALGAAPALDVETAVEPGSDYPPAQRRALTIGLVTVVTLVAFEALAVSTILPSVRDDLGGVRLYGWTFSAFLLMSLIGIVWAGRESDHGRPGRPFLAGGVLFGVGLVIAGLAPSMWVLVLGRAIQGLGGGVVPAVAYVAIGRSYSEDERPRMFALLATAWVVPGLIGPGIAAAIASVWGWRAVFLVLVPVLAFAIALTAPVLFRLGSPATSSGTPQSLQRALQLVVGAGLLLTGLTLPSFTVGLPLTIAGVALSVPAARALTPRGTLSGAPGLPAAILGMALLTFAFFGADAFIPFALTEVRGTSTFFVGAVLTVSTLAWTAGSWTLERTRTRFGPFRPMLVGLAVLTIGTVAMAGTTVTEVHLAAALVAWSVGGYGIGLAYPSFSLAVLSRAKPGAEGATSSSLKLMEAFGSALGAGLAGAIVSAGESSGHERLALGLTFGLMAAAVVAAMGSASRIGGESVLTD